MAWRLREAGLDVTVLEARGRLGGRALTRDGLDLGPTWVWASEVHIHTLLRSLGVPTWRHEPRGLDLYDDGTLQRGQLPRSTVAEQRVRDGMGALVEALADRVGPVALRSAVTGLTPIDGGLAVHTSAGDHPARAVVAALPPALVAPWVPGDEGRLLAHTPVWMGSFAKCTGR